MTLKVTSYSKFGRLQANAQTKMTQQEPLPMFDFSDAVGSYAQGESGARGAIFTRREVVEFILNSTDLAEYNVLTTIS